MDLRALKPRRILPRLRLRDKIVGLVVAVVLVSTLMTSVSSYLRSRDREYSLAVAELEDLADIYAANLAQVIDDVAVDAHIIADLTVVPRIIDSYVLPAGPDWATNDEIAAWRAGLSTIFVNLIEKRPHYTQLRLIGRAGNWREVTRVNQTEMGPKVVADWDLQTKGGQDYLSALETASPGDRYFFKVTDNREYGRIVGGPVLRLIQPVFNARGVVSAAIVINADYAALLRSANLAVAQDVRVTAVNSSLDLMKFTPEDTQPDLIRASHSDWTHPHDAEALTSGAFPNDPYVQDDVVSVLRQVVHSEDPNEFSLYVKTEESFSALLASANAQLRHDLLTSAVMALGSGLIALIAAMRITDPLLSLHRQISSGSVTPESVGSLHGSADEIGDLARAFSNLSQELIFKTSRAVAIFRNAGIAIVVLNQDGTIDDVNPAACDLFKVTADEIRGKSISQILPDASILCDFADRPDWDTTSKFALRGRQSGGTMIDVEVTLRLACCMSGAQLVAIIRDVTEFKRSQEDIAQLITKLKQSNSELDQFAYVASHDLKAPLRVIDNASRWLSEDLEPYLTDDTRESLDLLRSRVGRMERLLDDLLAHSRVGRGNLETELIDGGVLIRSVLELLDVPQNMRLSFSPNFEEITVSRMPLQTILLNLVSNAIKHHDCGHGSIMIEAIPREKEVEFKVIDDGPGIDPIYHEKIFQIFQTLKPRDQLDSSGMGLAIVKKYVDLSGGRIVVESDGVRGCVFRLLWPKPDESSNKLERLAS
ncbi:sensor histidine kinase [Roseivivax sp. CAU 1753]